MFKKLSAIILLLGLAAMTPGLTNADPSPPAMNVSKHRHPNLAAAQRLCDKADKRIHDAQQANEFDLGGHAVKAMQLLDEASAELKQAAGTSNQQHAMGNP
jgi:hypothetical protein